MYISMLDFHCWVTNKSSDWEQPPLISHNFLDQEPMLLISKVDALHRIFQGFNQAVDWAGFWKALGESQFQRSF